MRQSMGFAKFTTADAGVSAVRRVATSARTQLEKDTHYYGYLE